MEHEEENQLHLVVLCKSLGHLWSEEDVIEVQKEAPSNKRRECNFTLFGKLYSKANVNFQAILQHNESGHGKQNQWNALRKNRVYSHLYLSLKRKRRVLKSGPWSFASNLLVLKQCELDVPEHCYDFSRYEFWVHIIGLPPRWIIEEVYSYVAGKVGGVREIQLESKGNGPYKTGKVKVEIELSVPLKTRALVKIGNKNLWVEFKYERLPHFCYSCGKIGHYASYCEKIPYEQTNWTANKVGKYGPWLKAEVRYRSPHWEAFYGKIVPNHDEEEYVPETPSTPANMEIVARVEDECRNPIFRTHPLKLG